METEKYPKSLRSLMNFEAKDNVRLVGEFSCSLTADEANEWHEYIRGNTVFNEYVRGLDEWDINLRMLSNPDGGIGFNGCRDIADKNRRLKEQLYDIGKAWYAELCVRRAAKLEDI